MSRRSMRDRAGWIAVLSTAGVLMSACGGGDDLSPDGEHFAGLDAATVAEVLENPVAMSGWRATRPKTGGCACKAWSSTSSCAVTCSESMMRG